MYEKTIKAKKSLGQNFLHAKSVLNKIIECSNLAANDFIVEVGPGQGALTEKLLGTGAKVMAIEKDARLIPFLNEKFAQAIKNKQLQIIEGDALELDVKKLKIKKYKIVANIPYYLTGALLRNFLEQKIAPESITVLVQKEVADRIVARDNKESILSLSVKFFGQPKKIMNVPRKSFKPVPGVDSAILHVLLTNQTKSQNDVKFRDAFFDLIKRAFAHKRKTVRKNLIDSGLSSELVDKCFAQIKIDEKARPEDINIKTWLLLTKRLY